MGCSESSSKIEVYSNMSLPKERRKPSNKQPNLLYLEQQEKEEQK